MPDRELQGELRWHGLPALGDPILRGEIAEFSYEPMGWTASGTITRTDQGLVISHLEIDPHEGGAGITITLLREVPVREILAQAQGLQASAFNHPANVWRQPIPEPPSKPSPGRAPLTDEFLRSVAIEYLKETAPGKPRGAVGRLVELYGKPTPTVSRWIMRAREAGWLGPAVPGRVGAEPGPKLIAERSQPRDFRQRGVGGPPRPREVKADEPEE